MNKRSHPEKFQKPQRVAGEGCLSVHPRSPLAKVQPLDGPSSAGNSAVENTGERGRDPAGRKVN